MSCTMSVQLWLVCSFQHGRAACVPKFIEYKHTTLALGHSLIRARHAHNQDDKATVASSTRGCVVEDDDSMTAGRLNPFGGRID
jgi:hypothetical protein